MDAYEAERAELLGAFAEKLRALRESRFATQEELGYAARLHRTHIGFLEQGRREPSLSTLLILAETLGVPVQELVDGLLVPRERRPSRRRGRRRRMRAG
jgi:transcriptional regulator with XRE-family HTH domain